MAVKSGRVMLAAGAKAPSFRLCDTHGMERSLDELLAGGPVLLAFFKGSCPVCQYTFPFFERLKGNSKIRIFAISQDDPESTKEYLEDFSPGIPSLIDEHKQRYPVSNAFGISQVPSMFQIEPDGVISRAWAGWSRADMADFGERAGMPLFRPGEQVPEVRPG
jgi:peroxiredoxin